MHFHTSIDWHKRCTILFWSVWLLIIRLNECGWINPHNLGVPPSSLKQQLFLWLWSRFSMYFLSREPRQMDRDRNGMTFENFYGANILIWNDWIIRSWWLTHDKKITSFFFWYFFSFLLSTFSSLLDQWEKYVFGVLNVFFQTLL